MKGYRFIYVLSLLHLMLSKFVLYFVSFGCFFSFLYLVSLYKTVKTNDKIRRFGVVMTPLSRKIWIRSCKLQHLKLFWREELTLKHQTLKILSHELSPSPHPPPGSAVPAPNAMLLALSFFKFIEHHHFVTFPAVFTQFKC